MLEKKPEIGERVILISKMFGCTKANPVWGSSLACSGVIRCVEGNEDPIIRVGWDNGTVNSYRCDNLNYYSILPENNPNITFLRSKNKTVRRKK